MYDYPVKEITKIYLDNTLIYDNLNPNSTYKLNKDFFVYDDYIEFETIPQGSTSNRRALKIFYTIEKFWDEDVIEAIKEFVADMLSKRQYSGRGVRSFSFAGLSVTLAGKDLPPYVQQIIDSYQKILI